MDHAQVLLKNQASPQPCFFFVGTIVVESVFICTLLVGLLNNGAIGSVDFVVSCANAKLAHKTAHTTKRKILFNSDII